MKKNGQTSMDRLRDLKFGRVELEALQERLARLRSAAAGSRDQQLDLAGVSTPVRAQDRIGRQLAQIEALQDRILRRTVELEREAFDAHELIDALPPAQRAVMLLRYEEGLSWKEVAEKMHYSVRRCAQMHDDGVRRLSSP